jgi:N-acetylmuramic acid 6-phosphate etherase
MAVAGSTRMQVTTVELLVAGAALEAAAYKWMQEHLTEDELKVVNVAGKGALDLDAYADAHQNLLDQLSTGAALEGLTKAVELEYNTYMENGLVTYLTHDYLLDIMTDTTERQPTFTLPPFKKFNDKEAQVSWAYVKDPLYPNTVAWQHLFRRPVKGLEWTKEDYIRMGADQQIINNPPKISGYQVLDYNIGNEVDDSRYSRKPARLLCMDINDSANKDVLAWFNREKGNFSEGYVIRFGQISDQVKNDKEILIPVELPRTCTDLMTHLLIKLSFNLMSTATMAKMGRVFGNWMVQVLPTNKKLIDRSTRIIANLAKIPYEQANLEFFKSYYNRKPEDEYKKSYVVETLERLGFDPSKDIE